MLIQGNRVDLAAEDQDDLVRECLADLGVQEDQVELEEPEEVEVTEEQVGLAHDQWEEGIGEKVFHWVKGDQSQGQNIICIKSNFKVYRNYCLKMYKIL